jgi:hypothetical protein
MEQEVKTKRPFYKKWWVWVIAVVVLLMIAGANGDSQKTQKSDDATTAASQKQYQQIFTFSGNGAKKSEPFTIQGDRFKIAYDCKGNSVTLCTAFVFKVGSSLPQAIMNSQQPVKDETIIYSNLAGKGEYYIDANTLGSFTMTVYDYK